MSDPRQIQDLIAEAIGLTAGQVGLLADEIGTSRMTIHSWASGRRRPTPENLSRLVAALRHRGARIETLARELERFVS